MPDFPVPGQRFPKGQGSHCLFEELHIVKDGDVLSGLIYLYLNSDRVYRLPRREIKVQYKYI